jgi:hypothetical protein
MELGGPAGDSETGCLCCEFLVDVSDVVVVCEKCNSRAHFDCVEGTDAFRLCAGHGWLCYTCCGTMRSCDECGEFEWSYNYCETCAAANLITCSAEGCSKTLCQGGCHEGVVRQYVIECPICKEDVNYCCLFEEEGAGCCMTLHYEQAHGNKNKLSWKKKLGFEEWISINKNTSKYICMRACVYM